MAGSNGPGRQIDQIWFGYGQPNLLGDMGYGPLTHTLSNKNELRVWTERLHLHFRSDDSKASPRPPASHVYWSNGENAALLRRIRTASDNRDDWCHAVVGPAAVLGVRLALCMDEAWWNDLRQRDPQMRGPVDVGTIRSNQKAVAARLTARSLELDGPLMALAAAALSDPQRPVSIINNVLDIDDRKALLWALLDLTGPAENTPPWTFSTYETRHDDGGEPLHVLFLPEEPLRQSFGASRVMVNLSAPTRDGRYEAGARAWVTVYRHAGRDAAREWREQFLRTAGVPARSPSLPPQETDAHPGPHGEAQPTTTRTNGALPPDSQPADKPQPVPLQMSTSPPGTPADSPPREPLSQEPSPLSQQESAPPDPSTGEPPTWEQQLTDPASRTLAGKPAPMELSQDRVDLPPHRAPGRSHITRRPAGPADLVNQLGKTREPGHALQIVERIKNTPTPETTDRSKIRKQLYETHFWVPHLEKVFDVEHQPYNLDKVRLAVRALIVFAFPVADLNNPVMVDGANRFVASRGNPRLVAEELVLHVSQQGYPHALDPGCAARWKRQASLPAPLPHRASAPSNTSRQQNRWQLATIVLAACLAALLLVLLVQLLSGNSTAAGPTTPSTASTVPTTPPPYPDYPQASGRQSLQVDRPTCSQRVYIDFDGPPHVQKKPPNSEMPPGSEIFYSADCQGDNIFLNLTDPKTVVRDVPRTAGSHLCRRDAGTAAPTGKPPYTGQQLCIYVEDRLFELTVVRADPGKPLQIVLTAWKR